MAAWLSAVSIGAGYCFGAIVGLVFYERHREVRRKKRAKEALGDRFGATSIFCFS